MSSHPSIIRSSGDRPFRSWPFREEPVVVHLDPDDPSMQEFGSELDAQSPSRRGGDDDRTLLGTVLGIAVAEALVIAALLVYFSGVLTSPTGTLLVESQPPGAEVRVDGAIAGTTPLSMETAAGTHSVELRRGAVAQSMQVDVGRGETTRSRLDFVSAPPSAAPTEFRITSDVVGAAVSVDGVARGTTPLTLADLSPGPHIVVVLGNGRSVQHSIDVEAGRSKALQVVLPAAVAGPGWIELPPSPPLQVYEDGRLVGVTAAGRLMLSAGRHALDFINEELGVRVSQQVVVQPGASLQVTPQLPRGRLSINAEPWAEVWINGERAGETPIGNLSRPVGQYEILVRHPELGERRVPLRVVAGETARLNMDLRQSVDEP